MAESIFEKNLKDRANDQQSKAVGCGLEKKSELEQIHLSIPADLKEKFVEYCDKNRIKPSTQLRMWILEHCD